MLYFTIKMRCNLFAGRMQLENSNESLRIQLATTVEQLEELQLQLQGNENDEMDTPSSGAGSVTGSVTGHGEETGSHDSWDDNQNKGSSNTPKSKTPTSSPAHKLIRHLQHKVEMSNASKVDSEQIIDNLNKHIDSMNLTSSSKINELLAQNVAMKEKVIQLTAGLDAMTINYEESEKKVMSLVTERYNLQSDLESHKAQIVYLKSRQHTLDALAPSKAKSTVSTMGGTEDIDGGKLTAHSKVSENCETTTIEMVNTLIVQNKNLLESNMAWEQRYESMDLLSKAAVKGRKVLTEENIELKSEIQRLLEEKQRLESANITLKDETDTAKHQAKVMQKDLLLWRKKYDSVVESGGSMVQDDSDDCSVATAAVSRGMTYGRTDSSDSVIKATPSNDNEKDYLIHVRARILSIIFFHDKPFV
jgi:hypothetical protein